MGGFTENSPHIQVILNILVVCIGAVVEWYIVLNPSYSLASGCFRKGSQRWICQNHSPRMLTNQISCVSESLFLAPNNHWLWAREDDHLLRGTDECVSVGGVLWGLGKINNKLYYHWIHVFLPFHWPRANHNACKLMPTNNGLLIGSTV